MTLQLLNYQLHDGFIHNWLVAGPYSTPAPDLTPFSGEDLKTKVARYRPPSNLPLAQAPAERAIFNLNDTELTWRVVSCEVDHFVDLSTSYHTCHFLQSWAYTQVESADTTQVTLTLTTNGPADVWINGDHVHRQEHFCQQIPCSVSFLAELRQGRNEILVSFEAVAVRECPYVMALQMVGIPPDAPVCLPTLITDGERRQRLERVFALASLDRDVFSAEDEIVLRWPEDMADDEALSVYLQNHQGRVYAESWEKRGRAGASITLGRGRSVPNGAYQVVLQARPEIYFNTELKLQRRIDLVVQSNGYSESYYGGYEERCIEALKHAAQKNSLYSEIAKMELERWPDVQVAVIQDVIDTINQRSDGSDLCLIGLIGMLARYGKEPQFPHELKAPLEACILDFRYWMDEPGDDAMCFWSESHQILFHACEILAGQIYHDRSFTNNDHSGQWHREQGERRALSWLHKRGTRGFREWDSNTCFEETILALTHLVDLARAPQVREMAAVVLDKLLFSLALNSFGGVFGSTHGRTYTPFIKGSRREGTSGIGRIAWGLGTFNERIGGTVGLACATSYEVPSLIQAVALDRETEIWNQERHAGDMDPACDRATGHWEVNKVTYKTADFMLASAQDYRPGERGYQQHIWQATLGPDAVVFVTHPPCVSEEGAHRPNFWHGNAVLPRVAQWKDVVIDVRNLPDDDWLGFTHAYFPTVAFDEHVLRSGWAFARRRDGYLALTAAQGFKLVTQGANAYRELRSYGHRNVWLCHQGRAATDGSFADFQEKILALDVHFDDLAVTCATLRGDSLAFSWEGSLRRNGEVEQIQDFNHYENAYCSANLGDPMMEIRFGEYGMRLDFTLEPEAVP